MVTESVTAGERKPMHMASESFHATHLVCGASRAAASEIRLRGSAMAPGVALGEACFYHAGELARNDACGRGTNEAQRMREALATVAEQLQNLARDADAKLGHEAGDVFRAHGMM